jgi:hypothetical protein
MAYGGMSVENSSMVGIQCSSSTVRLHRRSRIVLINTGYEVALGWLNVSRERGVKFIKSRTGLVADNSHARNNGQS